MKNTRFRLPGVRSVIFLGQLERQRMAVLKARRVVEGAQLLGHASSISLRVWPAPQVHRPDSQSQHLAALVVDQPSCPSAPNDQARIALKVTVGGVRHPVVDIEL